MSDFKVKCTKFSFGWGSAQTPLWELTSLPRPLAGFEGPTSKGTEGEGERLRRGEGVGRVKGGKEREEREGGAEERGKDPLVLAYTP